MFIFVDNWKRMHLFIQNFISGLKNDGEKWSRFFFKREKASARASSDRFLSCVSPLKPNIFLYPKFTYQVQNSSNNSKILIQTLEEVHKNSGII